VSRHEFQERRGVYLLGGEDAVTGDLASDQHDGRTGSRDPRLPTGSLYPVLLVCLVVRSDLVHEAPDALAGDGSLSQGAYAHRPVHLANEVHRLGQARYQQVEGAEAGALELDLAVVVEAELAPGKQQVDPAVVQGDEEVGVSQTLVAQEERHELGFLVVDVPHSELAHRLGKGEAELLGERLATDQLAVLEGMRRQDEALFHHRGGREAGRKVHTVCAGSISVQDRQSFYRVELIVEGPSEDVACPWVDSKEDQAGEARLLECVAQHQFFVDIGGAHDVTRAGGSHVHIVGLGVQTGRHQVKVDLGDQRVDDEVDLAQRPQEGLLVVHVQLAGNGFAGRQLVCHSARPRFIYVCQDDRGHLGNARDGPGRHLADRPYSQLEYLHLYHPFPR
jgi:hypothetical protein